MLISKAFHNRGFRKGERGDSDGEIADYTATIELPGAPADEGAKALFNRGIAKGPRGDSHGAITEYATAIELPGRTGG